MLCPKCNSAKISVIDTRSDDLVIRRRRECQECQTRFTTFEKLELSLPMVVKKNGSRETFNSNKIRQGIIRACQKRQVSLDEIDSTVSGIERDISYMFRKEITSNELGEIVLGALKKLDTIAYVRFVSVYHEFNDLKQFISLLQELEQETT